jgi:hypothetical protein
MNYTFSQTTGQIKDSTGKLVSLAYSGNGVGLLNPLWQQVKDVGPLPRGSYHLQLTQFEHKGPRVFNLIPNESNIMFDRDGFMIHWDNVAGNFTASSGCIVPLNTPMFWRFQDGDTIEVTL